MQTEQNRKDYQGIRTTEAFEFESTRNDFVAITEKNEKQYVRLPAKYNQGPEGYFPLY